MIRFTLQPPNAGWADVDLQGSDQLLRVTGSYLSDCLRDLVDAIQSLATTNSGSCSWEKEPGKIMWNFQRVGNEVELVLNDTHDGMVFRETEDWRNLAHQVLSEFERVRVEMTLERDQAAWNYPFPVEACEKLRRALHAELT